LLEDGPLVVTPSSFNGLGGRYFLYVRRELAEQDDPEAA
jgi:hypothetical protein